MLVDPKHDVNISALWFKHYPAVALIDPHRSQVLILDALDPFVIKSAGVRTGRELIEEFAHLPLLLLWKTTESGEKIGSERQFHGLDRITHRAEVRIFWMVTDSSGAKPSDEKVNTCQFAPVKAF